MIRKTIQHFTGAHYKLLLLGTKFYQLEGVLQKLNMLKTSLDAQNVRSLNMATIVFLYKPPYGSYSYSWTDQCSKVDGSVWSEWLYEWWSTALLNVAVIQCQAAEVAVQLQCHSVPAAITDTTTGDA